MAKILGEVQCPHCEKKHNTEVDIGNILQKGNDKQQTQHSHMEEPHVENNQKVEAVQRTLNHDDLSKLMPKGVNYSKCVDGNCGKKIKNSKFTKKFKKCPNCSSNTVPQSNSYCNTCGIDETRLDDDWEDSEIEFKAEEDDEDE